jgi:hypothetical protein
MKPKKQKLAPVMIVQTVKAPRTVITKAEGQMPWLRPDEARNARHGRLVSADELVRLHVTGTPADQQCNLADFLLAHEPWMRECDAARVRALKPGERCSVRVFSWVAGPWENGERIHRETQTTYEIERTS